MTPSNIGWTDYVWNAGGGCARVSPGCEFCWAETLSPRLAKMGQARHVGLTVAGENGARWSRESADWPDRLAEPLKVKAPKRVFVFSMSDLFYEGRSFEYIAAVFGVMAAAPWHTFQVLTKRPARALEWSRWIDAFGGLGKYIRSQRHPSVVAQFFDGIAKVTEYRGRRHRDSGDPWCTVFNAASFNQWPLSNVHLGVTVEDQQRANERIPLLLQCPAAVRWVSVEPLLGPIDFTDIELPDELAASARLSRAAANVLTDHDDEHFFNHHAKLDWAVVGGETGEGRRERPVTELEDVARQFVAAGVPVFVKQDAGKYPGRQGRISEATWARKEFPADAQRAAEGGR